MQDKPINPFINKLVIDYTEVIKSTSGHGITKVVDSYNIEHDESVRIYTCKANREHLFKELTMYGRDMLLAIYYFVNRDYDYVILNYAKVLELYGSYGKRRYDDTIRELVRLLIIDYKDKSKDQYWYNPVFFSSGNRLKMYPQCGNKVKTVNNTI